MLKFYKIYTTIFQNHAGHENFLTSKAVNFAGILASRVFFQILLFDAFKNPLTTTKYVNLWQEIEPLSYIFDELSLAATLQLFLGKFKSFFWVRSKIFVAHAKKI